MTDRRSAVFGILWLILKRTVVKFFDDSGPFLASGLAFDLLLSSVPFSLLVVTALAYALGSSARALDMLQAVLQELLPTTRQAFTESLSVVLEHRGLVGFLGGVLFFLTSSITFGSARKVLNVVFQVPAPRSFFKGKATDVLVMLITSGLLALMIALVSLLSLAEGFLERFPRLGAMIGPGWLFAGDVLGFLFTLALFYLLYRYCPAKTLQRSAIFVASLSGTALFELSKWGFAWYVDLLQRIVGPYGAVGAIFFFLLWAYYASAVLILGAEIGWVLQKELPSSVER
jgi:membrane protein